MRSRWASVVFLGLLTAALSAQRPDSEAVARFTAADATARQKMLFDVAAARWRVPIADAIAIARVGIHDSDAHVRVAALAAVAGRAMQSRWAGTPGPQVGPRPDGSPSPRPEAIPAEWRDDQRRLRDELWDDCAQLLRPGEEQQVREYALMAVANVEVPPSADQPFSDRFIDLMVSLFYNDSSSRLRVEAVKTFRMIPNDSDSVRAVLRDGLVDPDASVRREALASITPQATGGPIRLTFGQARVALDRALTSPDPGIRLGSVQALNVFGRAADAYIPALERLQRRDPDAQVRTSAALAIQAIRRAMR